MGIGTMTSQGQTPISLSSPILRRSNFANKTRGRPCSPLNHQVRILSKSCATMLQSLLSLPIRKGCWSNAVFSSLAILIAPQDRRLTLPAYTSLRRTLVQDQRKVPTRKRQLACRIRSDTLGLLNCHVRAMARSGHCETPFRSWNRTFGQIITSDSNSHSHCRC